MEAGEEIGDYVRSTSEQSRLRALSLLIIRGIVEKHGGSLDMEQDVDLANNTISINVPEENKVACCAEITEAIEGM